MCLLIHEVWTEFKRLFPSRYNRRDGFPSAAEHFAEDARQEARQEARQAEFLARNPPRRGTSLLNEPINPSGFKWTGGGTTRSNMSHSTTHSRGNPRVSIPFDYNYEDMKKEWKKQQNEDLHVDRFTHHTYKEPSSSHGSVRSDITVPIYANDAFTEDLAYRYARLGKPKIEVKHAPAPGDRPRSVFVPTSLIQEPKVREWRPYTAKMAEKAGYIAPELRARKQSFLCDLAKITKWLPEESERERIAARDRRLADAVKIPPPRQNHMFRRQPLRMPGAFPNLPPPSNRPWYGKQEPELPDGVRWKAGGSMPRNMAPRAGVSSQRNYRSVGRTYGF
jgi:hypothetical protein